MPKRKWLTAIAIAAVTVSGIGIGWAAATAFRPAEDPTTKLDFVYATVTSGEVGASIKLNAAARWSSVPVGNNQAQGVVTDVLVSQGQEVRSGETLYTVNLRPVVIAQGNTPAFRALNQDTKGDDMAQLQNLLSSLGFYDGDTDGIAGSRTVAAIKAWQKSLQLDPTGEVALGDVIFIPTLPAQISLDPALARGATLVGGENAINALQNEPLFTLPVTEGQASIIAEGAPVDMQSPSGAPWSATVTDRKTDSGNQIVTLTLSNATGSICGTECSSLSVTEETLIPATITTIPTVTGLVVPSAAVVTSASNDTQVIDSDGRRVSVKILASASGMSVVEGLNEGDQVRVPGAVATE